MEMPVLDTSNVLLFGFWEKEEKEKRAKIAAE